MLNESIDPETSKFINGLVDKAPTAPARVVHGNSRVQLKEIAIRAYENFLDDILNEPLVQNNMMAVKIPVVLFYSGETENARS